MKEKQSQQAIRTARFSIIVNLLLAIVKGITGGVGSSFALVADAIESITDVFASLLVILGLRYTAKPADENHPYGHGRMEPLVTFIVVAGEISVREGHALAHELVVHVKAVIPEITDVLVHVEPDRGTSKNTTDILT